MTFGKPAREAEVAPTKLPLQKITASTGKPENGRAYFSWGKVRKIC